MENVWNFYDLISMHWPWKTHGIKTDHDFPMAILLCQNAMEISWIIPMGNFYKGRAARADPAYPTGRTPVMQPEEGRDWFCRD